MSLWRASWSTSRSGEDAADLARALEYLSNALDRNGRYDEALAAAEEAVAQWRPLAEAHPAVHDADLARAVESLGAALDQVGRYPEALAVHEEAVRKWRPLAEANPSGARPRPGSTLLAGCGLVHRRAHQRMGDVDGGAAAMQQAGPLGVTERGGLDAEDGGGPTNDGGVDGLRPRTKSAGLLLEHCRPGKG